MKINPFHETRINALWGGYMKDSWGILENLIEFYIKEFPLMQVVGGETHASTHLLWAAAQKTAAVGTATLSNM